MQLPQLCPKYSFFLIVLSPNMPTPLPGELALRDDSSVAWALMRRTCLTLFLKQFYWDKFIKNLPIFSLSSLPLSPPCPSLLFQLFLDKNDLPSSRLILFCWSLFFFMPYIFQKDCEFIDLVRDALGCKEQKMWLRMASRAAVFLHRKYQDERSLGLALIPQLMAEPGF